MAHNEPQRKETPPRPSPNSPSLLFEYQCRSGKFIRLANRIESKLFCPNWNALTGRELEKLQSTLSFPVITLIRVVIILYKHPKKLQVV